MEEVIQYIEELLQSNDCVIIPGLGGFVAASMEAYIQKDAYLFVPPRKEVTFNLSLRHDDELLLSILMQRQQLSKEEARSRIQHVVGEMWQQLTANREVKIGRIGRLYYDERSDIRFECTLDEFFFPEYFGLQPFRCLEWRYLEEASKYTTSEKDTKKEYIHIRIPRYNLQQVAAGVVLFLILLLISKPIEPSVTDYASLIPTVSKPHKTVSDDEIQNPDWVTFEKKEVCKSDRDTVVPKKDKVLHSTKTLAVKERATEKKTSKPAESVAKKPKSKRCYYIVVGSVTTDKEAQVLIGQQRAKGYTETSSLSGDGRIRVYVKSFTDRADADAYLTNYRTNNPQNADAWLLSRLQL